MPSEPIVNHRPGENDGRLHAVMLRRRVRAIAVVGLAMLVLAGCAEGTSRDAQRGREADAERTSVVDSLQATASANLIRRVAEGTPPPDDAEGN